MSARLRAAFATSSSIAVLAILLLPVLTVFAFVGQETQGLWQHLAATVLGTYVANSILLVFGVVVSALILGAGTAWLVTMYEFPLRRVFEMALVLPLAMPAYILAYAYTDFLQATGSLQTWLRAVTGWSVNDYWFFEIRSLGGATMVLSLALYPYVYLIARAAFLEQSMGAYDAARTLGQTRARAFWRVALPMARPALAGAGMLVAMETLADFGAVKYFDLEVMTTGIYRAWFAYSNPAAAAQLASLLLFAVFAAVMLEQASRGRRRYASATAARRDLMAWRLRGGRALFAVTACAMPVVLGFVLPVLVLAAMAAASAGEQNLARLVLLAEHTAVLGVVAAAFTVALSAVVTFSAGRGPHLARTLARFSYLGYATPGVVAGVGLLIVAGGFDFVLREYGVTALAVSGSFSVLIYAYLVRFFAVAHGPIDAAFVTQGPRYGEVARSLGMSGVRVFWRVDAPLMSGTVLTAAALVFVDVMKELPATMILRPFNFETLATEAFQLATTERLDLAAAPSLAIAAAGLIPVTVLCLRLRALRGRAVA